MNAKPTNEKPKSRLGKRVIFSVLLLLIIICAYVLLKKPQADKDIVSSAGYSTVATTKAIADGKALSAVYCKSCHMYPEPSLINKAKWKNVFPQMGLRLGIKQHRGESYMGSLRGTDLVVPSKPAMNDEQWQHIIDFYIAAAPEHLSSQSRSIPITRQLPFFNIIASPAKFSAPKVLATYVKIDTTVKPARIFVANSLKNQLLLLDQHLKVIDSIATNGPVVDMSFYKGDMLVCTIGKELGANSDKLGNVYRLHVSHSGKLNFDAKPMFSNLARPVQVLAADINGDSYTDYLLCEFGSLKGDLCWMENKHNGSFTKHVISDLPGAIKAYVEYAPGKKLPDLWVMFAQGEEGIYHFINKGDGHFEKQQILRFPAVYGSSYFELTDVNRDGYKDIVYTCGDNGNASLVLKPYHGVYVYVNDTHGRYTKQFFYPINGCYKAIALDFDNDGKVDLATASLFTDARQPEEGFVYLHNTGGEHFKPYAMPRDTAFERAVTLDAGDLNGDGKPDLLIGNAYFDIGPFGYHIKEPLFYLLKNTTK
ncbi:VCBS repeat-containing protein [Mucilaginibacter terrenus]|uniref:VCBS repeat-containing protein n=1 Tax=Mucilaginibacter terrenus TaxID=2482727 RepID=A0A3E2NTW7_9SPHI|nr:FG-GAP-like repeat-containing protein [Mucilaginibacter terrenus]RFZ84397.1 VCBS repeat-containing protein [Mucilaginibacter terrenus]